MAIIVENLVGSAWRSWTPSFTGFSADPVVVGSYTVMGRICFFRVSRTSGGTSNSTALTFTLPIAAAKTQDSIGYGLLDDGSVLQTAEDLRIDTTAGSTTATAYKDQSGGNWTASGTKFFECNGFYEIA